MNIIHHIEFLAIPMLLAIGFGDILGGIGAVSGIFSSFNQGKAANRAAASAADAEARRVALAEQDQKAKYEWLKRIEGIYAQMKDGGYFDIPTRIQRLQTDSEKYRMDNMENTAASIRTMGYKPGDSVAQKGFAETESLDAQNFRKMANELYSRVPQEELAVLGLLNPTNTNPAQLIDTLGQSAQFNMADSYRRLGLAGDPSQAFAALMPYIDSLSKPKNPMAASIPNDGTWNLWTGGTA